MACSYSLHSYIIRLVSCKCVTELERVSHYQLFDCLSKLTDIGCMAFFTWKLSEVWLLS